MLVDVVRVIDMNTETAGCGSAHNNLTQSINTKR